MNKYLKKNTLNLGTLNIVYLNGGTKKPNKTSGGIVDDGYIRFKDPEVLRVLLANGVDTDGDGSITEEEAAAVTSIWDWFKGNTVIESFNELFLFKKVTTIHNDAFKQCKNLHSVNLSNIKVLGKGAFTECSLLSEYGSLDCVESLGDYAFNGTSISGTLRLPRLITMNGTSGNTLAGTSITEIADLGLITTIPAYFFRKSTNLEKATIPDTVVSINRDAFDNCGNLKTIVIGAGIETIARGIIYRCLKIESIVCKSVTPPSFEEGFVGTNSTFLIYVPDASVTIYRDASVWSQYSDRIKPLSEYTE